MMSRYLQIMRGTVAACLSCSVALVLFDVGVSGRTVPSSDNLTPKHLTGNHVDPLPQKENTPSLEKKTSMVAFFDAIRSVESGGDDRAVGDGGASRGPLQCGRDAWSDACEYGRIDWDYDTYVWDFARVSYIAHLYWKRYGATTDEARSRIWNGGPSGMSKAVTIPYWNKVRELL